MKMKKLIAVLCAMMLLSCPMASISAQELDFADEGMSSEVTASENTQEPADEVSSENESQSEDESEPEDAVVSENASEPEDSVIPEEEETPEETTQPEESEEVLIVTEFTVDENGDVVKESITPYASIIRSTSNNLEISGGVAYASASISCYVTATSIQTDCTLQRLNNGTWYTYNSWSTTKYNTSSSSCSHSCGVTSGTYRLMSYFTVKSSSGNQSALQITGNKP